MGEFLDIDSLYTFEPVESDYTNDNSDVETFDNQFEFGSEIENNIVEGADDTILPQVKSDPGNDIDIKYDNQANIENNLSKDSYQHFCNLCDYQAKKSYQLKSHIESKHEGVMYSCNQCDYQAKKRDQVKTHRESKHEGIKYSCNQCEYQTSRKSLVKKHTDAMHGDVRYSCT